MEALVKFVQDEFVQKKISQNSQPETLLLYTTRLRRVKKQELSFLEVL